MRQNSRFSTLLKKLELHLQQTLPDPVPRNEYIGAVISESNRFFEANGLPFMLDGHARSEEFAILIPETRVIIAFIETRRKSDRRTKTVLFRSIVKTGAWFDFTVPQLIVRRTDGISHRADAVLREAMDAGYGTMNELLQDLYAAERIVAKTGWIRMRFEGLDLQEQSVLRDAPIGCPVIGQAPDGKETES